MKFCKYCGAEISEGSTVLQDVHFVTPKNKIIDISIF